MKEAQIYQTVVNYWQDAKEQNNEAIAAVLDEMEQNPSIPCTQEIVAKKAGVSKSSVRNRTWANNRIKQIKADRKKTKRIEKIIEKEDNWAKKKKQDDYLNKVILELHYWHSKCQLLEEELMSARQLYDIQKQERTKAQFKLEAIEDYLLTLGIDSEQVVERKLRR